MGLLLLIPRRALPRLPAEPTRRRPQRPRRSFTRWQCARATPRGSPTWRARSRTSSRGSGGGPRAGGCSRRSWRRTQCCGTSTRRCWRRRRTGAARLPCSGRCVRAGAPRVRPVRSAAAGGEGRARLRGEGRRRRCAPARAGVPRRDVRRERRRGGGREGALGDGSREQRRGLERGDRLLPRLGLVDDAVELADRMARSSPPGPEPNLVTWNTVLSGCDREAVGVVRRMLEQRLSPDATTVSSLLKSVAHTGMLAHGMEIHGYFLRHQLEADAYTGTALVDMYAKCGRLDCAQTVFDALEHRNLTTWNSLVAGHANAGQFERALELVDTMKRNRLDPNVTTWNGLITGYSMNGLSSQAMLLLRQIKAAGVTPNVVSWTSLISGSCQNGEYEDSFYFFNEMQKDGVQPSLVTMLVLLRACAGLALLKKGKELHGFALRRRYDGDMVVGTALIDMYSKAGSLTSAKRIFGRIQNKNLVCCNAMLTGLAVHGQGHEAIALFHDMWRSGLKPDSITFTALLTACRSMGLITEGWEYFDSMETKYGVTPTAENYACMVDLLARCGYLDEAMGFIEKSPIDAGASLWGALLTGCSIHGNLDLAEVAARNLFRLEPYNSANYLLMMSLYEHEQMFDEAESLKYAMKARGVNTRPGWSWIQIEQRIHVFEVDGSPHPETVEIYEELSRLVFQIRKAGYVPDTSCIVYNVPEEEKEKLLLSHTEKLAITYGLIRSDASRTPVRVIKNTRMCNDCHEVAKHISSLCDRQIILRDAVRFHHFVDGKCSCNDYW